MVFPVSNIPTSNLENRTLRVTRPSNVSCFARSPAARERFADFQIFLFPDLSTVELAVLIACKHLSASTIDFQAGFNLEMAYDQYLQWAKTLEARGKRVGKGAMSRDAFCSVSLA